MTRLRRRAELSASALILTALAGLGGAPLAAAPDQEAPAKTPTGKPAEAPTKPAKPAAKAPAPVLPEVDALEAKGLEAEAGARYEAATGLWEQALDAAVAQLAKAPDAASARIEYLARRLHYFYGQIDAPERAIKRFKALLATKGLGPLAAARVRIYLITHLEDLGEWKAARQQDAALGLVQSWQLIGPFDNERGTGFGTAFPPEKGLDFTKAVKGKVRPVRWRPIPVASAPTGAVLLDELFKPADQGLAYALTFLKVEAPTEVALRIGSDEGLKVFVNGQEVLAHDRRRPLGYDQSEVGVTLNAGWNAVMLKVCDQTGGWGFRMRVTSPKGGPVEGLTVARTDEIRALGATFKPATGEVQTCAIDTGAMALLAARIKAAPQDAEAHFRLGYLNYTRKPEDQNKRVARGLFDTARKLAPKNAIYLGFYAMTAGSEGEFSVNKEENKKREALEQAIALHDGYAEARQALASYYWRSMRNPYRARELVTAALKINETYSDALSLLAELDENEGLGPLVVRRERALAAKLTTVPWMLRRRSRLAELGRIKEAEAITDAILKQRPGHYGVRSLVLNRLQNRGDFKAAIKLARRLANERPWSTSALTRVGDMHETMGDLGQAVAAYEEALQLRPEDPEILKETGRLMRLKGDKAGALASFERALAVNPNDPEAKRYVRYLKRGKGKPFEDEWVLPTEGILAAAAKVETDRRQTHRVLLRNVAIKVGEDGLVSRFQQELIRIENDDGIRRYRGWSRPYYVGEQVVEFKLVRVIRKDGRVEEVPGGQSRNWGAGEFSRFTYHSVSLPPLQVGDIIEVQSRTDDQRQGFFGDYFGTREYFRDEVPLDHMRLVLVLPKSREFYFHASGMELKPKVEDREANTVRVFETKGVDKLEPEPYMPWRKETLPSLSVSTFKDWDSFAKWYWALVRRQHESDADIKALVKELTKDARTEEEKIRKVYEYVVSEIRYNASWEFGIHGFKPYNATSIFARKFGDCKDKSTLINTMLKEVGIESYPVLIFGAQWPGDARGVEDISLPLMNHFNHCISFVLPGEERKGRFLDGTAQHHPYGSLPTMDYGANVVVVTPKGALMKTIPMNTPAENAVKELTEVILDAEGKAVVRGTTDAKGSFGVTLRGQLENEGRRKEFLERILGRRYPGAKVTAVKTSKLEKLSEPVKVQVEMAVPKGLQMTGNDQTLVEVESWLFDALSPDAADLAGRETRELDLILPNPRDLDETVRYTLPAGVSVKSLPKATKVTTPFGTFEKVYELKDNVLTVKKRWRLGATRVKKENYKAFREFMIAVQKAGREKVVLEREARKDPQ